MPAPYATRPDDEKPRLPTYLKLRHNDADGRRPVFGGARKFQEDPHWHDCILFYEYFHGDNGAGIGASHQTGWTGIVAKLIELLGYLDPDMFLETPDFLTVSASAATASRGSEIPR